VPKIIKTSQRFTELFKKSKWQSFLKTRFRITLGARKPPQRMSIFSLVFVNWLHFMRRPAWQW